MEQQQDHLEPWNQLKDKLVQQMQHLHAADAEQMRVDMQQVKQSLQQLQTNAGEATRSRLHMMREQQEQLQRITRIEAVAMDRGIQQLETWTAKECAAQFGQI